MSSQQRNTEISLSESTAKVMHEVEPAMQQVESFAKIRKTCDHEEIRQSVQETSANGMLGKESRDKIGYCLHHKQRARCRECNGALICEHNKERPRCKECKGSQICIHGCLKWRCKKCKGVQVCAHNKLKIGVQGLQRLANLCS